MGATKKLSIRGNLTRFTQQQADAAINQAGPVSTTLYDVLATAFNVRILSISVSVIWTVQPTPLEIVITIDGITIIHAVTNPISTTSYLCVPGKDVAPATQYLLAMTGVTPEELGPVILYEGRTVRVQARTTGGTVQNLIARVKWARIL